MILVLGGTLEGREIASTLAGQNHEVLITVVSGYGAEMIPENSGVEVLVGQLDGKDLERLITEREVRLIVDATHPYAWVITETAWETANLRGIPYIRYERPAVLTDQKDGVYRVASYEKAAELAASLGNTIFLTIGSKNIASFVKRTRDLSKRVVARVLPDPRVLDQCLAAGLGSRNVIAVQGPFSFEMNLAMFREYKADVLVTKDSGQTGGADTKVKAAAHLEIPVIVIERPNTRGMPMTDSIPEILAQAGKLRYQSDWGSIPR